MWSGITIHFPTSHRSASVHAALRAATKATFAKTGDRPFEQTVKKTILDRFPISKSGICAGRFLSGNNIGTRLPCTSQKATSTWRDGFHPVRANPILIRNRTPILIRQPRPPQKNGQGRTRPSIPLPLAPRPTPLRPLTTPYIRGRGLVKNPRKNRVNAV